MTLAKSPDSLLTAGLWDCTAGTFTWIFGRDEIVHVLEGEVRVHDGDTTHVLVPGSVAYFPRGLETVWEVRTYMKKAFVLRAPQVSPLGRAAWPSRRASPRSSAGREAFLRSSEPKQFLRVLVEQLPLDGPAGRQPADRGNGLGALALRPAAVRDRCSRCRTRACPDDASGSRA